MKKYLINVNGNGYEVEVEEIKEGVSAAPRAAVAAPVAPVAPRSAPAPKAAAKAVPAGASTVNAPMPGTILGINVKVGESVKRGQILCILEAMKMENEIRAGADGTIKSIEVKVQDQVSTSQALFVLG